MTSLLWSTPRIFILQLTPRLMQLDLAEVQTQTPQVKRWSCRSLCQTTFSSLRVWPSSYSLQCAAGFLFQHSWTPLPAAMEQEEGVRVTGNQKTPGCPVPILQETRLTSPTGISAHMSSLQVPSVIMPGTLTRTKFPQRIKSKIPGLVK